MKLALSTAPSSAAAGMLAIALGFTPSTLSLSHGSELSVDGKAATLRELLTALAEKAHRADLVGESDAVRKQVEEWFEILASSTSGSASTPRSFLDRLNTHLLHASFLAAGAYAPTIADYAVYAAVRKDVSAVAADLPHLARWSRYLAASLPAAAAGPLAAWLPDAVSAPELPPALQSRIFELDLLAAAQADSKLRSTVPAAGAAAKPAGGAEKKDAAAPAAGKGDAKKADAKPAAAASSSSSTPAAAPAAAGDKKDKKEKAPKAAAPAKAASAAAGGEVAQVYRVDFRVGRIVSCEKHPTEARLLVEQIDVGEATGPRTVVSGLADFYQPSDLVQRLVVVMVNLKAGDLKGVVSNGRVMVATSADGKVKEVATPPEGAKVGERITFATVPAEKAPDAELAPKRLHDILKGLHTNGAKVVQYEAADFMTSAGPVTVPTVADGTVA